MARLIGLLVALLGRWGIAMMTTDPQITLTLMIGTVLGVIFFKGVAVGPLIAGGITYVILTVLKMLGFMGS